MSAKTNPDLDRITITVPKKLTEEIDRRLEAGGYASVSEWVRHAIREQLQRELSPLEKLIAEDPRVLDSLMEAKAARFRTYSRQDLLEGQ